VVQNYLSSHLEMDNSTTPLWIDARGVELSHFNCAFAE
jgi:hypothetical protein